MNHIQPPVLPPFDDVALEAEIQSTPPCASNVHRWVIPAEGGLPVYMPVDVVRCDGLAERTYEVIPSMPRKELSHEGVWGELYFAVVYPRMPPQQAAAIIPAGHQSLLVNATEGIYQQPNDDASCQRVAIKRLQIQLVAKALEQNNNENPFREIYRMRTLGDNVHMLRYVECLRNDQYLYIIMPMCESLLDGPLTEDQGKVLFRHMLENLVYLKNLRICHRDISPDNCMIFNGRMLFIDPAMATEMGPDGTIINDGRQLCGKLPYWSPEVVALSRYGSQTYNGIQRDYWAAALSLYSFLTFNVLYNTPIHEDVQFRIFIMAEGLSRNGTENENVLAELDELEGDEASQEMYRRVVRQLHQIDQMTPTLLHLFENTLTWASEKRWTLEGTLSCPWLTR